MLTFSTDLRQPVRPGEVAPEFALPLVDGSGTVTLSDYRSRSAVFLALMIGLWCPFCRRNIAQLKTTADHLRALGVETIGVVTTSPENARTYFKYRPSKICLLADPDRSIHRAYGVPRLEPTPELMENYERILVNPAGDLPEPLPAGEASRRLNELDGYRETERDRWEVERDWSQLKGQFMIDRRGVVRWTNIECLDDGYPGIAKFSSADEIYRAAETVQGAAA